ncbi:MAG: protein jag [Clostridia bacterium]|jgi:spoIIIJ-associated protein|nr:protein jag [Clostridia bacterium]
MNSIEISARTVEEAIKMALEELNLTEDEVNVEVLDEPSKGFLGILGGKMAKVKVTPKIDPLLDTKEFLLNVTEKMGLNVEIKTTRENEYVKMEFVGNDLGILIGRRGDTLDALQYLVNLIANKHINLRENNTDRLRIILDAEDYRQRREETLTKLAHKMADKVQKTGRKVVLEPMNPQERRIIHTALQDNEAVQTISEGAEPFRRIIIKEA